jgi:hypothetical protein
MGGNVVWNPKKIIGLTLLIDPDTISGADGDAISSLVSSEGSSHNFAQTSTKRPLLKKGANGINGHNTVLFDGVNDLLVCAENIDSSYCGYVFAVVRLTNPVQDSEIIFSSADEATGNNAIIFRPYRSSSIPKITTTSAYGGNSAWVKGTSTIVDSTTYLMIFGSNGFTWSIRLNGSVEIPEVLAIGNIGNWFGDSLDRDSFVLGALKVTTESGFFKGDLGYLAYINRRMSLIEIDQLGVWLANRFGLSYTSGSFDISLIESVAASSPLTTPTYDGSGQAVHPSVYDSGTGNIWNGHRYWMAMTPFPAQNAKLENPSILVSDDGNTWSVPDGLTNPVVPYSGSGHNFDPFLYFENDILYLFWMEAIGTARNIFVLSSTDGITWSDKATIFTSDSSAHNLVAPSIIKVGSTYYLYAVDLVPTPDIFVRYSCATLTGTYASAQTCVVNYPRTVWHANVKYVNSVYYAYFNDSLNGCFMYSADGVTWNATVVLPYNVGVWDKTLYAGSILPTANGFDLWYSAYSALNAWRIGRTTITGLIP